MSQVICGHCEHPLGPTDQYQDRHYMSICESCYRKLDPDQRHVINRKMSTYVADRDPGDEDGKYGWGV
jgi:uncharacterized CHY-type Zn-finger protein